MMSTGISVFLTCLTLLALCQSAAAFGAGEIPDWGYLNDKAFRHGDIEGVLSNLAKSVGGTAASGGLMGIAASVLSAASGGSKFSKLDVKRVYFGNWLRDYSQAMDIAGLSKLTAQTLVTVVSVLGFMTFGFATAEFEVSADRLGVYLPIEHIDNPKGYAEKEGDARQFHPKLRPPVNPRELEINPRNGMKNYIATEGRSWDTSSAHVRRTLQQCIDHGRRARGQETDDQWEAFRLLGTALHTLEDLLAHSNWCELALRKLGHQEVFCHVGDEVIVNTPNGPAPPLVTGTFGSADFMYSVLGEGMDHLSEASVSNLTSKMDDAKNQGDGPISTLKAVFSKMPSFGDSSNEERMEQAEDIKSKAYDFNPKDVAPEDIQRQMWQVLQWRDGIYREVVKKIEMVPGLGELIDELTNALNAYVFTVLEPVIKPMLQQATGVLQDGSKAVIDTDDQYEVFNDPNASDPSHSILSKDHFDLILNEPAGKIAQVVVEYSVNLIVKAWYDKNVDANRVIDQILEAFHHPYFATGNSDIQRQMMDHLERWIGGLGSDESQQTLQALTKESVRAGKNKRPGSDDDNQANVGQGGRVQESGGAYGGYGDEGQTRYGTGEDKGPRYEPRPSKPTYARYDGQQRQEHHAESNDYSSNDPYGQGRRIARDRPAAADGLDTRHGNRYGADVPAEVYSQRRQVYTPPATAEEPAYGTRVHELSSTEQYHHRHHHHSETRTTEYGERPSSYGQGETYGQQAESGYGSSNRGVGDEYGSRSDASRHGYRAQEPASGGYGSTEGRGYGAQTQSYENSSRHGRNEDAYTATGDGYGGTTGGRGYGAETQSYESPSQRQSHGRHEGSYLATGDGYGGGYGETHTTGGRGYGAETQSHENTSRHGRHHEDATGGYGESTRTAGYAPSYENAPGGYGARTAYVLAEGTDPTDTFGAEGLTLEDTRKGYAAGYQDQDQVRHGSRGRDSYE